MSAHPPIPPSARPPLLHASGTLVWRRSPLLMGVVNITPDSFSDGGRWLDPARAVEHALQLAEDGADLLDLGAESSRPGASPVAEAEEMRRLLPVLHALRPRVRLPISVDTTKAAVARAALDAGADLINDISGLRFDAGMLPVLAGSRAGVVLMHMQGEPGTMQAAPHYGDAVAEVGAWLGQRLGEITAAGVAPERVLLDPGIGFGKRLEDNLALIRHLDRLRCAGRPLLIGASRKAFLGHLLSEPVPEKRLEGDLAVAAWCHAAAVEMLRVHEVRPIRRLFSVLDALTAASERPAG